MGNRAAMGGRLRRFLERVKRAGADIAINDAECADRCCEGKGVRMAGDDG